MQVVGKKNTTWEVSGALGWPAKQANNDKTWWRFYLLSSCFAASSTVSNECIKTKGNVVIQRWLTRFEVNVL